MSEKGPSPLFFSIFYIFTLRFDCIIHIYFQEFLRTRLDVIDERYLHLVEQDIGKKLFNGFRKTAESAKHKSELENNMKTAFKMAAKTLTVS